MNKFSRTKDPARWLWPILIALCSISALGAADPRYTNERFALHSVRNIQKAQMSYTLGFGNGNFGSAASLGQWQLIDPALASGVKHGYAFNVSFTHISATLNGTFSVTATPLVHGKTGRRSFFIDHFGRIRGGDKGGLPANATDPVIDDCSDGSIAENERCTKYSVRFLTIAQGLFHITVGNGNYATLSQLASREGVDPRLGLGVLRGYLFMVTTVSASGEIPAEFQIYATPLTYGTTGRISYYVDKTGVIRGADHQGGPAGPNDPPVSY